MTNENERLDGIAEKEHYAPGVMASVNRHPINIIKPHLRAGGILELGAAEGVLSEELAKLNRPLTLLDGAESLCGKLRKRFPAATVVHSLVENFNPPLLFGNIVMSHFLEHVKSPEEVLRRAFSWLRPKGRLFAFVPNAMSLHREAAVIMRILPTETALNETDKKLGHRRVFTTATFRRCFSGSNLKIVKSGGYWLKPLSNRQIEQQWSDDMLRAFLKLGERHPDVAAEIYIIAEKD